MAKSSDDSNCGSANFRPAEKPTGFTAGLSRCFAEVHARAAAALRSEPERGARPAPNRRAEENSRAAKTDYFLAFFAVFFVDFFFAVVFLVFFAAM
jgi:hypothetical protein